MTRRKLHVLLTSIGGLGVPKLIEALRAEADFDFTITGVDAGADPIGAHFVDFFANVPYASAADYADTLLNLCRKSAVEVVVPGSDGEAVALARAEPIFAANGIKVLCSPYETAHIASNKYRFMCHLRDRGIPVPQFFLVRTPNDAQAALAQLGFPERPVVFKPIDSAGSRGFRIVTSGFDELRHVLNSKKEVLLSAPRLLRMLEESSETPELLLMEYLEGDSFSTEVLVREGRAAYIIPQRRIAPKHGSIETAVLAPEMEVEKCAERIVAAMPFRYLVNIDAAFRYSPRGGDVLPYDINPRLSAIVTGTGAAGCFLLAEAMRDAVGMKSVPMQIRPTRMARYWNEHYSPEDGGKSASSVQRVQRKEPV